MRKFLLSTILFIILIPIIVNAESNYLYDVLKNEAESSSGLAREYTGEHNDVMEGGDKKIYHWYSETAQNTALIQNKWNVLFAGKCWEAFRTTDGGGTKLLYNGIPVNNTCKDDRTRNGDIYHVNTYSYESGTTLSTKFSKSYTYNTEDQKYHMNGDMFEGALTEESYRDIIGMYTCNNGENVLCDDIYEVIDFSHKKQYSNNIYYYYVLRLIERPGGRPKDNYIDKSYYSIGNIAFTEDVSLMNRIGYMYDKDYEPIEKTVSFGKYNVTLNHLAKDKYEVLSNDGENKFTWNTYYKYWEVTVDSHSSASLKFNINEAGDYVLNWGFNCDYTDLTITRNGIPIKEFMYSKGLWSNRNIVLEDVVPEDEFEVIPKDSFGDHLKFEFYVGSESGTVNDTRIAFGKSFKYENGKYILQDVLYTDGTDYIKNNHYTCLTHSTECEKAYYSASAMNESATVFELVNGQDVNYLLNEIYYKEDINKKDSMMKKMVDLWFEENILDYQDFLEPTIYCNNRNVINKDTYYFNPNGGISSINHYPSSRGDIRQKDISCPLVTDQFSVNNPKAKLKYSVALPTAYELNLAANEYFNNFIFAKANSFQTMSPYSGPRVYMLASYSSIDYSYGGNSFATRPVITLKSGVEYESGNGSKEEPYIIDERGTYSVGVDLKSETKNLEINIEDITSVKERENVRFKVTPIKGYKVNSIKIVDKDGNEIDYTETDKENEYSFIMPASNVTIIPSYERVKNSVSVNSGTNTEEIIIEVNDAKAVVYEDVVKFKVTPKDGYEVETIEIIDKAGNKIEYKKTNNINEYEFIMPDTDVTIKPMYRLIPIINDDSSKQAISNPNTIDKLLIVVILLIISTMFGLYSYKRRKFRL